MNAVSDLSGANVVRDTVQSGTGTVLFVSNTSIYGGAEKHLLDLVGKIPDSELRLVILCTDSDPFTERIAPHRHLEIARCRKEPKSILEWCRIFRAYRPNVIVFIHGVLSSFDCRAFVAARLCGVRHIHALHHLIPPPRPPKIADWSLRSLALRIAGWRSRHLISVRIAAMLTDQTVCVSHAVKRGLVNEYHFSSAKTVVIHNGVDVRELVPSATNRNFIREKLGIRADELVLVCVARLSPMKGIDILLDALARLMKSGHSFKCIIVGDGPLKTEIMDRITSSDLSRNVILEGFQSDVRPYLQAADIFTLASHREGLPFSILEAMACGLPCVVTDVGGNAEAVESGQEGLIVNPGSAEEMSDAIAFLLTRPDVRTKMSKSAGEKARKHFDIDFQMREYKRTLMNWR